MARRLVHRMGVLGLAALLGCVDPVAVQEKFRAFQVTTLSFLVAGRTPRQEILLRLGAPTGRFENDRIFTYDFVRDQSGEWRRVGGTTFADWRFQVLPGTCSLVLVFREDGVLERHAVVLDRDWPAPAPEPDKPESS